MSDEPTNVEETPVETTTEEVVEVPVETTEPLTEEPAETAAE